MATSIKFYIINCLGFENEPNAFDLLVFSIGSFILISILSLLYKKIPKSTASLIELENPIYKSKDILLQQSNFDIDNFPIGKATSNLTRIVIFILIALVAIIPLYQLFGFEYFL